MRKIIGKKGDPSEYENLEGAIEIDSMASSQNLDASSTQGGDTFTVEEAVNEIGFGWFQLKLSFLTGLCWMSDAMEMMILSILAPALHCAWGIPNVEKALLTTVVFCGMMVSSPLWGKFGDLFGRKVELILCSVWVFYFGFLSSFSPTLVWMLVLRALVGFGIGGVPQSITLYSEFLPSVSRARCIVLIETFWAIGTAFEVLLALFVMPTLGWRYLLAFSALPIFVFCLCCVWLPESPRFDVTQGQRDRAYQTLQRIAKDNGSPMPKGTLAETPQEKRGRLVDLFTSEMKWTTILLWFIWFASAFAYYGIVLVTTELFEAPTPCEGILVTVFIIDLIGRRWTMCIEFVGFAVFVLLVNVCASRAVTTALLFVGRAFISGAFQAAYVYTPEVYPTTTRSLGLGTCSGFARVGAIITPFVAQVMLEKSIHISLTVYAIIALLAAIICPLLPYETKGRAMAETHTQSATSTTGTR